MQTADVLFDKPIKGFMQKCFTRHLTEQYMQQINADVQPGAVDLRHKIAHIAPEVLPC